MRENNSKKNVKIKTNYIFFMIMEFGAIFEAVKLGQHTVTL